MDDEEWAAEREAARRIDPTAPMVLHRAQWTMSDSGEFEFLAPAGHWLTPDVRAGDLLDRGLEGPDGEPYIDIEYVEAIEGPPTFEQHRLAEAWRKGRPW